MAIELLKTNWFGDLSLQAYYRFESGALTTDSSGEGHTLTAISDPAEDASGKFGGAVALDGNDAYSAVDHADFKPTGNFTVGGWVKQSANTTATIISSFNYTGSVYSGWYLLTSSSGGVVMLRLFKNTGKVSGTDYEEATSTTDVCDGNWHFVVGTWDGTHIKIYVDGTQEGGDVDWVAPAYAAENYVRVGCYYRTDTDVNEQFVNGSLDDVFLLNGTALTASQIKNIYTGVAPSLLMNLAGNWKNN
jgi:hypothetical protein